MLAIRCYARFTSSGNVYSKSGPGEAKAADDDVRSTAPPRPRTTKELLQAKLREVMSQAPAQLVSSTSDSSALRRLMTGSHDGTQLAGQAEGSRTPTSAATGAGNMDGKFARSEAGELQSKESHSAPSAEPRNPAINTMATGAWTKGIYPLVSTEEDVGLLKKLVHRHGPENLTAVHRDFTEECTEGHARSTAVLDAKCTELTRSQGGLVLDADADADQGFSRWDDYQDEILLELGAIAEIQATWDMIAVDFNQRTGMNRSGKMLEARINRLEANAVAEPTERGSSDGGKKKKKMIFLPAEITSPNNAAEWESGSESDDDVLAYQCPNCQQEFSIAERYDDHLEVCEPAMPSEEEGSSDEKGDDGERIKFSCRHCPKAFAFEIAYRYHGTVCPPDTENDDWVGRLISTSRAGDCTVGRTIKETPWKKKPKKLAPSFGPVAGGTPRGASTPHERPAPPKPPAPGKAAHRPSAIVLVGERDPTQIRVFDKAAKARHYLRVQNPSTFYAARRNQTALREWFVFDASDYAKKKGAPITAAMMLQSDAVIKAERLHVSNQPKIHCSNCDKAYHQSTFGDDAELWEYCIRNKESWCCPDCKICTATSTLF